MSIDKDPIQLAARAVFTKLKCEAEGRPVPAQVHRTIAEVELMRQRVEASDPQAARQISAEVARQSQSFFAQERAEMAAKVDRHYTSETLRAGINNTTIKPKGKSEWDPESFTKLARGELKVEREEYLGRDKDGEAVTRTVVGEPSDDDQLRAAVALACLDQETKAGISEERAALIDAGLQDHRDASHDMPRNENLDPHNDVMRAVLAHAGANS